MSIDVTDYATSQQSEISVGGSAELEWTPPQGSFWLVDRAAIRATGATGTLRIYVGNATDENLVDGSDSGNFDIADNGAPWYVPSGVTLRFVWSGLAAGSVCSARIQYQVAARGNRIGSYSVASPIEQVIGLPQRRPTRKIRRAYGGW
jgi:hypothetical protein